MYIKTVCIPFGIFWPILLDVSSFFPKQVNSSAYHSVFHLHPCPFKSIIIPHALRARDYKQKMCWWNVLVAGRLCEINSFYSSSCLYYDLKKCIYSCFVLQIALSLPQRRNPARYCDVITWVRMKWFDPQVSVCINLLVIMSWCIQILKRLGVIY